MDDPLKVETDPIKLATLILWVILCRRFVMLLPNFNSLYVPLYLIIYVRTYIKMCLSVLMFVKSSMFVKSLMLSKVRAFLMSCFSGAVSNVIDV